MNRRKFFIWMIAAIFLIVGSAAFLRPCSFADVSPEVRSVSVVVIGEGIAEPGAPFYNTSSHNTAAYVYNMEDPEFSEILDTLGRYSYHVSPGTISSWFQDGASIEGNKAGYWFHIYLYTELDCFGECRGITSGGTGEVIVAHAVYRTGYWGNKTALKMMDEIYQIVIP